MSHLKAASGQRVGFCTAALVFAGIALSGGTPAQPAGSEDIFQSYVGTASGHGGAFLYRENHLLHYREGRLAERVVLYTCLDGSAFARKAVSYPEALAPDFLLDDASNGMREGVRAMSGVREVFFREDTAVAEKSGPLPRGSGLVIDTGFDEFVRANWAALIRGQALTMKFLVPSRLEGVAFRVQHARADRVDGVAAEVFRLKVAGVIGWVAPSIDVYYDARDHVLLRYVGISDLRDASHDNLSVDIDFKPADRHASQAQAMESARKAPLARCH